MGGLNMPLSYDQACRRARARSRSGEGADVYVVSEAGDFDVATEFDLETYYLGAPVVAHFFNGEMQE